MTKLNSLVISVLVGLMAASAFASEVVESNNKKSQKVAIRSLASLSSVAKPSMGQGEQMLYSVRDTNPRFLKMRDKPGMVKIAGVCHDGYGVSHYSSQKTYANCVDSQSVSTSSVNDYFGGSQRTAGVGVLVGN